MADSDGSSWKELKWRRRLETFGQHDAPILASGPDGEIDVICQPGELTDKGRETTFALGQRLRHLYVHQLGFMPKMIKDADMIYLRATPIPRALESVQQSFWGMYPSWARTRSFPPPTIITRTPADENLYPNNNCRRFSQLGRAFAQRAADRWNKTEEMDFLNSLISKWMPENSKRVAVDSHPRLSGIMDTINSTLAHGPKTQLPSKFYDTRGREIIDKIVVEEWFAGFKESREYRKVGIGSLIEDIVSRMLGNVERRGGDGLLEVGGETGDMGAGRGGEKEIKFAMSGCHDTTLAAVLSSLGAFDAENWPAYTSHIAIELFREETTPRTTTADGKDLREPVTASTAHAQSPSPRSSNLSSSQKSNLASEGIARKPLEDMDADERKKLQGFYVRMRYNDRPTAVPGCKLPGKHLEGDESFCTLEAFKSITDKFTPRNWKEECVSNLGKRAFPKEIEPAGL
ncbi:hypothetical protein MMC07_006523 [Pseudocyphellaria aurata]|nr:hypothetical protein [Pseudocyphellaria aurata]